MYLLWTEQTGIIRNSNLELAKEAGSTDAGFSGGRQEDVMVTFNSRNIILICQESFLSLGRIND
jgi:hypothetical protein